MPHRSEQAADPDLAPVGPGVLLALPEPFEDVLDDVVEAQSALEMLFGREPHLRVDHAVVGQVLRALARDPAQTDRGLHHRDGVREGLEVELERTAVGGVPEPRGESVRRLGG